MQKLGDLAGPETDKPGDAWPPTAHMDNALQSCLPPYFWPMTWGAKSSQRARYWHAFVEAKFCGTSQLASSFGIFPYCPSFLDPRVEGVNGSIRFRGGLGGLYNLRY